MITLSPCVLFMLAGLIADRGLNQLKLKLSSIVGMGSLTQG
jgi:hypothetical protein